MIGMRVRDGNIQTSHRAYSNDDGRRIDVVSTLHVGEPEYFRLLREQLDSYSNGGFEIHYEQVDGSRSIDPPPTDAERDAHRRMGKVSGRAQLLARYMGLASQHSWYPLPETWKNTDYSGYEIIRAFDGDYRFIKDMERASKIIDDAAAEQQSLIGDVARLCIRFFQPIDLIRRLICTVSPYRAFHHRVIVERRNLRAIQAAFSVHDNVMMVWGAGHAPGIHRELIARGFRPLGETWYTAVKKRRGRHAK